MHTFSKCTWLQEREYKVMCVVWKSFSSQSSVTSCRAQTAYPIMHQASCQRSRWPLVRWSVSSTFAVWCTTWISKSAHSRCDSIEPSRIVSARSSWCSITASSRSIVCPVTVWLWSHTSDRGQAKVTLTRSFMKCEALMVEGSTTLCLSWNSPCQG